MQKIFNKEISYIFYFFPAFLILGPAIPDIILSAFSLLFLIYCISSKNLKLFKNKIFFYYLIFWLILVISSLLSDLKIISLKTSLFHFRFIVFSFFFYLLIKKNIDFFKNFFPILLATLLITTIDGYYQFFFDVNLLGFDRPYANQRLSGFFNDEWILGSYLVRILPLLLCAYFLYPKKNNLLMLIFIFLYGTLIFLSGERTSFFLLLIFLFLLILFLEIKKIFKIFALLLVILIPVIIISINDNIKERMFYQVLVGFGIFEDTPTAEGRKIECCKMPKYLFSLGHTKHYEVGLRMFLDKPLFGHGPKSFRYKCHYFETDIGCSSHPHNSYIQLLSESGVLSFIMVLMVFFLFCILLIKNYLNRIKIDTNFYNARVCILGSFIINLFPIVPTGSFFTNWLNLIYFLPLGILLYLYEYPLYEKK